MPNQTNKCVKGMGFSRNFLMLLIPLKKKKKKNNRKKFLYINLIQKLRILIANKNPSLKNRSSQRK